MKFFVPVILATKGSTRAVRGRGGKIATLPANTRTKTVQRVIAADALVARVKRIPSPEPVEMSLAFYVPRPESHFTSAGLLRDDAPPYPSARPGRTRGHGDIDKLERLVLDALTGIAFDDDSQVVTVGRKTKRWASDAQPPGVEVDLSRALLPQDDPLGFQIGDASHSLIGLPRSFDEVTLTRRTEGA